MATRERRIRKEANLNRFKGPALGQLKRSGHLDNLIWKIRSCLSSMCELLELYCSDLHSLRI